MDIELRPGGESRMHIDGNWHSIYQGRIASLQDPRQPFFKGEILAGEGTDFPFRIDVESPLFPFLRIQALGKRRRERSFVRKVHGECTQLAEERISAHLFILHECPGSLTEYFSIQE